MAAQHCLTMAGDQQTERLWLTLHIFNIFFLVDPRQIFQTIVLAYLQHELHHFGVVYCTIDATLSVGMKKDIYRLQCIQSLHSMGYRKALSLLKAKAILHANFL